jgi:hypothetical protein
MRLVDDSPPTSHQSGGVLLANHVIPRVLFPMIEPMRLPDPAVLNRWVFQRAPLINKAPYCSLHKLTSLFFADKRLDSLIFGGLTPLALRSERLHTG